MPGVHEVVFEAWNREVPQQLNQMAVLPTKLIRTVKKLRVWSRSLQPYAKLIMGVCREVIHQLESAQEAR
jgi:hypothetical protein